MLQLKSDSEYELDDASEKSSSSYYSLGSSYDDSQFEEDEDAGNHLCLACHPNENLPKVALCCHGQFFHSECLRCVRCNNQIESSKAFLKSVDLSNNYEIYCMDCAHIIDKEKIYCRVCRDEIMPDEVYNSKKSKNTAVELKKQFFVHKSCLHCQICGLSNKGRKFSCVQGAKKKNEYIVCNYCLSIMNRAMPEETISPFVGRLIPDLLGKDFDCRCQNCHNQLTCQGFIYSFRTIYCIHCGSQFINLRENKESPKKY